MDDLGTVPFLAHIPQPSIRKLGQEWARVVSGVVRVKQPRHDMDEHDGDGDEVERVRRREDVTQCIKHLQGIRRVTDREWGEELESVIQTGPWASPCLSTRIGANTIVERWRNRTRRVRRVCGEQNRVSLLQIGGHT